MPRFDELSVLRSEIAELARNHAYLALVSLLEEHVREVEDQLAERSNDKDRDMALLNYWRVARAFARFLRDEPERFLRDEFASGEAFSDVLTFPDKHK